jgi:membrane fusion protein (multidrug efflux system)
MKKRIAFAILGLLLVVAVLGGLKALQIKDLIAAGSAAKQPPIAVTAVAVEAADWETSINALGTLEAAQGVVITADLPGRVSALYFNGGETVTAGKLLLEQENSTENAQLSAAESDLELAQRNLDRVARLFRSKVISRSEFDTARSQESAAQAQVDNITTSLDKKQITAPFDGRLGLRLVDIGQDLSQGVPIVSLQAIDPMLVNFSLPQQALANVKDGFKVRVTTDASPGMVFDGSITAINTEIDSSTRTVRTQATLDVTKGSQGNAPNLLPGMFATVEVVLPSSRPVLMAPLTAVNFATYGDSVFILEEGENDQLVARQQFVQLGERRGDYVEIKKGLEAGQTLANDGVFKLRNGAAVVVQDKGTQADLTPKPDNA